MLLPVGGNLVSFEVVDLSEDPAGETTDWDRPTRLALLKREGRSYLTSGALIVDASGLEAVAGAAGAASPLAVDGWYLVEPQASILHEEESEPSLLPYLQHLTDFARSQQSGRFELDLAWSLGFQDVVPASLGPADAPRYLEDYAFPRVWKKAAGSGVRVAVIDAGFRISHERIKKQVSERSTRVNGARSDLPICNRSESHGTMCAGVLAASVDSYVGGVAPDCEVVLVEAESIRANGDQWLFVSTFARALEYAAENAQIVSCSLGTRGTLRPGCSEFLARRITAVGADDTALLIWAACQRGCDSVSDDLVSGHEAVVSVAGLDHPGGSIAFGPADAHLAGPGKIYGIDGTADDGTSGACGTSCAAPWAAGVAALVKQAEPAATNKDLWRALVRGARQLQGGCLEPDPVSAVGA